MSEEAVLRKEVTVSQREINLIKGAILKLDAGVGVNSNILAGDNKVEFAWSSASSGVLPENDEEEVKLSLQLSSPVEEAFLYEIAQEEESKEEAAAAAEEGGPPPPEKKKGVATFRGVEISLATMTVSLSKNSKVLGISDAYEMVNMCSLEDAFQPKDKYTKEFKVTIVSEEEEDDADEGTATATPVETEVEAPAAATTDTDEPAAEKEAGKEAAESKVEGDEDKAPKDGEEEMEAKAEEEKEKIDEEAKKDDSNDEGDKKEADAAAETITKEADETTTTTPPETTDSKKKKKKEYELAFNITYQPSRKDQKEELIRLLNKAGERRDAANKKLRELKVAAATTGATESSSSSKDAAAAASTVGSRSSSSSAGGPAVKAGFLNKNSKKSTEAKTMGGKLYQWYDKYFGPQSFAQLYLPKMKNYVIFFAAVVFMHFQGQQLALPAPA